MRFLFIILLGMNLTGCVRYQPRPLHPEQIASQLQGRTLDSAELRSFVERNQSKPLTQWPPQRWNFEQLALAAYYFHPDLEVARAQWRIAEAGTKTAGGRPNPTMTVTPGFNSDSAAGITPWMPSLSFDVPIETAHKRDFRIAVARSFSRSAQFNISTGAWQVRSRLRTAVLNFVVAEQRQRLLLAAKTHQENLLAALKRSVVAGAISQNELRPTSTAVSKASLDLFEARRKANEARAQIAAAMGVPVSAVEKIQLADNLFGKIAVPDSLRQMQEIALKSRTDVLGLLAEYDASEAQLRLEIARQYPDVHITPSYQWDQGENKWALGVTVELPVLNRNGGPIAEAKAKREEVAARFMALQAKILSEVEIAFSNHRSSTGQLRFAEQLVSSHREQLESVEAQRKAGSMTQLDFMSAQVEMDATELSRLESEVAIQRAVGALEDALQKPLKSRR